MRPVNELTPRNRHRDPDPTADGRDGLSDLPDIPRDGFPTHPFVLRRAALSHRRSPNRYSFPSSLFPVGECVVLIQEEYRKHVFDRNIFVEHLKITDENTEMLCGPAILNILNNVELPLVKNLGSSRVGAISFTSYFWPNVTDGLSTGSILHDCGPLATTRFINSSRRPCISLRGKLTRNIE